MANAVFLRSNLITSSTMLSATALRPGTVTAAQKAGGGSGILTAFGAFTAAQRLDYKLQVQTSGPRGTATYRWSADGGATWVASGIVTSTVDATLNNGVKIRLDASTSPNAFWAGDAWTWKGYLFFGVERLIDGDPNTDLRTCSAAASSGHEVIADLGTSAATPDVLALFHHNFSSCAIVKINGSSSCGMGTLSVSEALAWTTGPIRRYLTTAARSFRYWSLTVSDTGNSTGSIRVSKLYLGGYDDPSRNMTLGHARPLERIASAEELRSGDWTRDVRAQRRTFSLGYGRLNACQRDLLTCAYNSLADVAARTTRRVVFDFDPCSTADGNAYLCHWKSPLTVQQESDGPFWSVAFELVEIPRSV